MAHEEGGDQAVTDLAPALAEHDVGGNARWLALKLLEGDTAVEGLKLGAFDYVQKPAHFDELLEKLEAARDRKAEHEGRIRRAEARSLMRHSGDV